MRQTRSTNKMLSFYTPCVILVEVCINCGTIIYTHEDEYMKHSFLIDKHLIGRNDSGESLKYRRKGSLIMRKLSQYVPVMIITNISALLIQTVDQVVAGNFIGKAALSSISIFYPVTLVIAVFSGPVASGIATYVSNLLGKNDMHGIAHAKSAALQIMITVAIAISLIQIPLVFLIISSYGLSDEMYHMVWQYAIGIMICTPFGIVSTVGTYMLQISGRMRILMILSIVEGLSNLVFDLLFVAALDMGVVGAGLGTACANFIRCSLTLIYIARHTDFFKGDRKRATLQDYRDMLPLGLPDAAYMLMLAFQNYFTLRIILHSFGEDGGAIYGLCAFCLSIANVLLYGVQGGMRPLMGLYTGGDDRQGVKGLIYHGFHYVLIGGGIISAAIIMFPSFFYHLNGVDEIPDGGKLAIQIYATAFIFRGFNHIIRLYLSNMKDIKFATTLTVLGSATLPLFALIISMMDVPAPCLFFSYLITELIIFLLSTLRYFYLKKMADSKATDDIVLYMTVNKGEAGEASQYVMDFAREHGIDDRVGYKTALCLEEMIAYTHNLDLFAALSSRVDNLKELLDRVKEKNDLELFSPTNIAFHELIANHRKYMLTSLINNRATLVDTIIRFKGNDSAILITLDEGEFIALDEKNDVHELITDNYELIRRVATSVEYQYVLNMNYTRITIAKP